MKHIGVTGNRDGLSAEQREYFILQLEILYKAKGEIVLHHGDCVGVDAQCHDIATKAGVKTVAHPPLLSTYRAFKKADSIHPLDEYLVRNRAIVKASERLIGFPSGPETNRGGTWYTIRQAKKRGVFTTVVMPDGTYEHFNIKEANA